jgi:hypothetical protein
MPQPPLPEVDPRVLASLEMPRGVVRLQSEFYIERPGDIILKQQVTKPGTLTYIRAPRQTGKSSLLVRGIHHAREQGVPVAFVDCQFAADEDLASLDRFLRCLAGLVANDLGITGVDEFWNSSLAGPIKMSSFLETNVLTPTKPSVLLAMDEVDRIYGTPFQSDFFGMVRAWSNRARWDDTWNKLTIAMVISTEPHLLIDDIYQSPFNIGTKIELEDFSEEQVADLNCRHGNCLSSAQVHEMYKFLGGHPYLTRKTFYAILTLPLSWDEFMSRATGERSPFSDHLRRYLWLLRDKPELTRAIKGVIKDGTCPDEVAFNQLKAAGLIRGRRSKCLCRCPLYRRYFEEHL